MKIIIILFTLFSWSFSYSQNTITGKVIDNETKQVIPFASIIYFNAGIQEGNYTDSLGNYVINILDGKVKISCIGYESLTINAKSILKTSIINLIPTKYSLNEVEVRPKVYKTIRLGYFINKVFDSPVLSEGYRGINNTSTNYVAQFISNEKKDTNLLITKLLYNLSNHPKINYNGSPNLICKATRIRLHLFTTDEKTGFPDKELLTKNIILKNDCTNDNLIFDIADQNIYMPSNGVFVGIEYIDVLTTSAISLFPFYVFNSSKEKIAIAYHGYHQENWEPLQSIKGAKFFARFGIEVTK